MNRNALVGAGLIALVLAALAVGMSTYMSSESLDQSTKQLEAKVGDLAAKAVMAESGTANNLSAVQSLKALGTLTVLNQVDRATVFQVGEDEGVLKAWVGVPLVVVSDTNMADLKANAIDAAVVRAGGFETKSGSVVAGDNGNVNADGDLVLGGNSNVGGDLVVSGARVNAGTVKNGIAAMILDSTFDAKPSTSAENIKKYDLADETVNKIKSLNGKSVLQVNGGVITSSLVLRRTDSGEGGLFVDGDITSTGVGRFRELYINTDKFTVSTDGDFTAAGAGSVGGNLAVTGNGTVGGTLAVSGDADLDGALVVSSGASVGGTLAVTGAGSFGSVSTAGTLSAGDTTLSSLTVTGDIVYGGQLRLSSKAIDVYSVSANNADFTTVDADDLNVASVDADSVSAGTLYADTSIILGTNKFTVDASGNGSFAGSLTVAGSLSAESVSTTNISAGNLKSGTTSLVAGSLVVPVSGMPSSASVVVTPLSPTTGTFYVAVDAGSFTVYSDDAASYNWIALW